MNTKDPTIVFLTVIPVEYQAVRVHLPEAPLAQQWDSNQTKLYEKGEYLTPQQTRCQIIVRQLEGMGNLVALSETKDVITQFQPNYLFFVGIAAKLKDAELGDVVATTWAEGYETGKIQEGEWLSRAPVALASKHLSEIARHLARDEQWQDKIKPVPTPKKPKALVAPIVSGEKVVDSPEFLKQLRRDHSQAAAVEMEGLGFLHAICEAPTVEGIVIRGISDAGENKAETDKHGWQEKAASHAAAFAFAMLDELLKPSLPALNPYPGLKPFRRENAKNFFGRKGETQDLLEQVRRHPLVKKPRHPLVVVIGASGSGKSSLVLAGLVPALEEEENHQWIIKEFRLRLKENAPKPELCLYAPKETESSLLTQKFSDTNTPLSTLVKNLLEEYGHQKSLLMIIDQFEELYTLTSDKALQHRFIYWLLEAVAAALKKSDVTLKVVVTLRADFMKEALEYVHFANALDKCAKKILGPIASEKQIREVIEEPALRSEPKVTFEKGLTKRILDDLRQPLEVPLPLLQFALNLLWEQQTDLQLTHAVYEKIGGVMEALSRRANEVYDELLNTWSEEALRHIFTQLVHPGDQANTKRVATLEQIGPDHWELVGKLADARLVVTRVMDEPSPQKTVELVHEALISSWGRLRAWIDEDREFRSWQDKLEEDIKQWEVANQDKETLLRGVRLVEAEEKMKQYAKRISPQEKTFIAASVALREREVQEREQQRRERERLQRRNLRVLATSFVIAVVLGLFGWWQWGEASKQRDHARQNEKKATYQAATSKAEAQAIDASAQFQAGTGEISALLAAMQAGQDLRKLVKDNGIQNLADYPTVRPLLSLQTILGSIREVNQVPTGESSETRDIDISPDGKLIAMGGDSGKVRLFDLAGHEVAQWEAYPSNHDKGVQKIKFSPDGKLIATGHDYGNMEDSSLYPVTHVNQYNIWDTSGKQILKLEDRTLPDHGPLDLNFSPDGQHFVGIMGNGAVRVWDLSGQQITQIWFNPADTGFSKMDLRDGRIVSDKASSVDYTPDGKQLVIGGTQGEVQIYDLVQQHKVTQFKAYEVSVEKIVISPDGQHILTLGINEIRYFSQATGGNNRSSIYSAKLWDMTGKLIAQLAPEVLIMDGDFSRDGQRIVTVGQGDVVEVWDLSGKRIARFAGHLGAIPVVSFSPDSKQILTVGMDNTLRFWNLTQQPVMQLPTYPDQNYVVFSPDNQRMIGTTFNNDNVRVYDLSFGKFVEVNKGDPNIPLTVTRPTEDGSGFVKFEEIPVTDEKYKDSPELQPRTARASLYDWSGKLLAELKTTEVVEGGSIIYFLLSRVGGKILEGRTFSISSNGRVMATLGIDKARVWDLSNQRVVSLKDPQELFVDKFREVQVSPNGKYILTQGTEEAMFVRRLWDSSSGKPVALFLNGGPLQKGEGVGVIPYSKNDRFLVVQNSPAMTAGLKDGDLIKKVNGKEESNLMDSGSLKCKAGEQKTLQVERRSGESADKIETLEFVVTCGKFAFHLHEFYESAEFSPDNQYVATWASSGKYVRLWNLKGELLTDKIVGQNNVGVIFFSHDSRLIGTLESPNLIEIWDLMGNKLGELAGVHYVSNFNPDNQRIATLDADKKIRVWDVKGRQLAQFDNFEFLLHPLLDFTPNGRHVVAIADDGFILLPIMELDELLGQGCYWLKDYLASHSAIQSQLPICQEPSILAGYAKQSTKIAEIERINVNFHLEQRKLQAAMGNYSLAMEELRMAVKSDPSLKFEELKMETGKIAIKALLDAARVSLENGDYKQSVDRYTQAQTIDPNEVSFNDWNGICWIGIFNNHAAEVMKACENTLIVSNNDELFRGARGVARAMTGDKAGALEDFEAFIRLANQQLKDSPTEKDQLLLETVILQWQHWIEQLRNGENPFTRSNLAMLREGLTALDTGFGFDPYYVGQVTENHKDLEKALSFYKKVTEGSNRLPAQKRVAWILTDQGKMEEALEYLRYIPNSKHSALSILFGMDLDDLNTESKKNEYFRHLIQFELDLIIQHQRFEEAMTFYNRLLEDKDKIYGEKVRILFKRALLADKMKRPEAFKQDLQQVLELENNTDELASLGWLLYQLGKSSEALDYLRKAQAKQTSATPPEVATEVAAHLGEVLWTSGQPEEAKTVWKKALKDFPDNQPLREVVKKFWPEFKPE